MALSNNLKIKMCAVCKVKPRTNLSKTVCSIECEIIKLNDSKRARDIKNKRNPSKPKVKTVSKLKLDLWDVFSLFIKLTHSKDGELCECYTCGRDIYIGTISCQGGHCLSKAGNPALYFDERAVRPQCGYCNLVHEGNHYVFCQKLKLEIGDEEWQNMYDGRMALQKHNRSYYIDKIAYYKEQCKITRDLKSNI